LKSGLSIYEIWTRENSDLIQNLGISYSERKVFEMCINDIKTKAKSTIQQPLDILLRLYGTYVLKKDIGWFITSGSINIEAVQKLNATHNQLIKELHKYAFDIVNSVGIPEHLLTAPVAQDYVEFNKLPWTTQESVKIKPRL